VGGIGSRSGTCASTSALASTGPCSDLTHHAYRRGRERAGAADGRAEQGNLFVASDAGGTQVFIEEGFELVMRRHFVALAAFLVETDRPGVRPFVTETTLPR
jgi:hypothetical protein